MKAINIKWDVDNKKDLEFLPKETDIPNEVAYEDGELNIEAISNYLTDETGFCHDGYDLTSSSDKEEKKLEIYEIYLYDSKDESHGSFFAFTSDKKIYSITEEELKKFFQKDMEKYSLDRVDISSLEYINPEILRDSYHLTFLDLPFLI